MTYTLLSEPDPVSLSNAVNDLLAQGWQLYGPPIVSSVVLEEQLEVRYFQAMTKE